jgi:hypothetical protein
MKAILSLFLVLLSSGANAEDIKFDLYGFLLANSTIASGGVDSLGRNNMVAYNAAANPALAPYPSRSSQSFQVQQSRLGLKLQLEDDIETLFEFDFVDFSKSSPTVAALPRLRQAKVTWHESDWTFHVGQMWDLFSPLAPTTYNYIGHYFTSGDLGFMRLQAQALAKKGNFEHGIAIGFPSFNNQAQESTPELSKSPTLSLRETYHAGAWTYGSSGIVGHLELPSRLRSQTPFAVNVFAQYKDTNDDINFESYYGHNTENLSLQGLGYSASLLTLKEAGFFITARRRLNEKHGLFYGAGYAKILNSENMTPSYSYVGGRPVFNLTGSTSTGYGIVQNATARLGYEYFYKKNMTAFFETAHLYTEYLYDPTDKGRWSAFRHAQIFEIGLKVDL